MDTQTLIQQIKYKQEELKKKTQKIANTNHKRDQSVPEQIIQNQQSVQKSHQSSKSAQSMSQDPYIFDQTSPLPGQNRSKNQTPNQIRMKQDSIGGNTNTPSPIIFRTPHVSLHQNYLNNSNLRYPIENNSKLELLEITNSKNLQFDRMRGNQQQQSNYKSKGQANLTGTYVASQNNQDLQQELYDHQIVLEEVMKKYRQMQQELAHKNRELQRTDFYKKELMKEKLRNASLRERNQMLKGKLLKLIEVVQTHQLEERQQEFEWEEHQMALAVQNEAMRRMLCLDADIQQLDIGVSDDDLFVEDQLSSQKDEVVDKIFNVMVQELKQIKDDKKKKQNQNVFNPLNLAMTVMNKQAMVDLEEEKYMKQSDKEEPYVFKQI